MAPEWGLTSFKLEYVGAGHEIHRAAVGKHAEIDEYDKPPVHGHVPDAGNELSEEEQEAEFDGGHGTPGERDDRCRGLLDSGRALQEIRRQLEARHFEDESLDHVLGVQRDHERGEGANQEHGAGENEPVVGRERPLHADADVEAGDHAQHAQHEHRDQRGLSTLRQCRPWRREMDRPTYHQCLPVDAPGAVVGGHDCSGAAGSSGVGGRGGGTTGLEGALCARRLRGRWAGARWSGDQACSWSASAERPYMQLGRYSW